MHISFSVQHETKTATLNHQFTKDKILNFNHAELDKNLNSNDYASLSLPSIPDGPPVL